MLKTGVRRGFTLGRSAGYGLSFKHYRSTRPQYTTSYSNIATGSKWSERQLL
jgi:hypothetical protein